MSSRRLYRSSAMICFYTETPRAKTPDPIAEARVTVVSAEPGRWPKEKLRKLLIATMIAVAPQTYWSELGRIEAYEIDEEIDEDELESSVPLVRAVDTPERQVVFFCSRKHVEHWWRLDRPEYWVEGVVPEPRYGDYIYNEFDIRRLEEWRERLKRR